MKEIQVLILAGGVGKRMWPVTANKILLPFLGKPLIFYTLERLRESGFKNLIVVVNPQIRREIEKLDGELKIVTQEEPLGQADAILNAERIIQDAPLLIVNGDDFYDSSLLVELRKRSNSEVDALLVGVRTKSYLPMGYLITKNGEVKEIVEKPGPGNEPSDMVRLVVDFFKNPKLLFEFLKENKNKRDKAYEIALSLMMRKGIKFGLVRYEDSWATIKYPWDILKITEFLLAKKKDELGKNRKDIKILKGAVVKNSYLGKGVVVGNHALIRDSIIEDNCVIGFNTEIARSYIGPNCWFHANYIGDSVLERDVSFGSGARTANLRLDEREITVEKNGEEISTGRSKLGAIIGCNVRVGINTSLMPGVMIGRGSFIGPGLILGKTLDEGQFCYRRENLIVKKNLRKVNFETRKKFKKKI